jgi:hypothetical protein
VTTLATIAGARDSRPANGGCARNWPRAAAEPERRVFSRELSFVPSRATPKFEAHDAQTRALIAEYKQLEQYRHGASVLTRLENWKLMDALQGPRDKQAYLEPLIAAARSDPMAHQDKLIFLLVVLEPIRRGVSGRFVHAHGGVGHTDVAD